MINNQTENESMTPLQPAYLRILRLIATVISIAVALAIGVFIWGVIGFAWYFGLLVFLVLAGLLVLLCGWYLRHWYQKYSYQLDTERLAIKRGVFWRHHISVPVSRVQHVDVNSGPLDRRHNLAKLVVNTAGTHHAQTSLPGLSVQQAHDLRDSLLAAQQGDTV